jgi:hypothetical protein
MSDHQISTSAPILQRLPTTLPAQFERAFGFQTQARWVGLYWEPQLGQPCYTDGETVGLGSAQAWQLFCTHPDVKPLLSFYQLGDEGDSAQHYLVLDRQNQQLYAGEAAVVSDCLKHPAALDMLAQLNQSGRQFSWRWPQKLKSAADKKWMLAFAGLLAVTLGFGLLYGIGEVVHEVVEEVLED